MFSSFRFSCFESSLIIIFFFSTYVGRCPEDHLEMEEFMCQPDPAQCDLDHRDVGQWRHQTRQNNSKLEDQHDSNHSRFKGR